MRKIAVVLVVVAAAASGLTHASPAARRDACGLPDVRPLWLDYAEGSVAFRQKVFGHPGVIAATSGEANSAALRATGAQTVYWWMKLGRLVGTPARPTDPATVGAGVDEIVTKAVAASGCATPVVVLNELNSAGTTTPWTGTNAQYRANVLQLVQGLAARGARPLLLVSARPYTSGDAVNWWLQVAQAADLVREVYFPAPPVMRAGAVVGSRNMRRAFREGVAPLTAIGIPPERLGIVIGFQSGPGKGGREGMQPTSKWLRFVKLQTLAAQQVAGELRLGSIVSWGWGTFDQAGADPDKARAACVYLWARDEGLCNGPTAAGPGFNASLSEGQIALAPGARCSVDGKTITQGAVRSLAAVTGDSGVALSALFARLAESTGHGISKADVLALEQSIVDVRFGGSRPAYLAALRDKRASVAVARDIIADQLRRAAIAVKRRIKAPTASEIALYYGLYGDLPARRVKTDARPSWLGGKRRGFALVPPAPERMLTLPTDLSTSVVTTKGPITVTALDDVLPLAAIPLSVSSAAVRAALEAQARMQAFSSWSVLVQGRTLGRALCTGDVLPAVTTVDLASYLPFLALDA